MTSDPFKGRLYDPNSKALEPRQSAKILHDIPEPMYAEIGRVITKFSVLEYGLQQTSFAAAGLNRQVGRIAMRAPRATERIDLIKEILAAKNLTLKMDIATFRQTVSELQSDRDGLAHGVWVSVNDQLHLGISQGTWQIGGQKTKRVSRPGATPMNPDITHAIAKRVDDAIVVADQLQAEVFALTGTSLDTLRPPGAPNPQTPNQTPK